MSHANNIKRFFFKFHTDTGLKMRLHLYLTTYMCLWSGQFDEESPDRWNRL